MTPSATGHDRSRSMDIPRPDRARAIRRRRWWTFAAVLAVTAAATVLILRIEPASPLVEIPVWTDTVKRGELLRQVRGPGTLVPEQIQYVQSETEGRVERIFVQPGTEVFPETILLELSNPELRQESSGE